ncbi:MAG: ABC-F family ATP-binding cassette domain-containing protein [Ignavibacteriaceae bacterium]
MIDLSGVSLQFGGRYLFENLNYKIHSDDKIALVGLNGSGKSSLLKLINGDVAPESGAVNRQKNISIGYLPQENITHSGRTLIDEAMTAYTSINMLQEREKILIEHLKDQTLAEEDKNDMIIQLGNIHHKLEQLDAFRARPDAEKILSGLGFSSEDFNRLTEEFSGGWQMRIALAKILISQCDIILLDEPTNHLDIDTLQWLTGFLKNYDGAFIIVSHDKHFLNQVTNKTIEILNSKIYSFNGRFEEYLKFKDERNQQAEQILIQQQKKIKETERFIERFRYKASKARQVQSRIKQLDKLEKIEIEDDPEKINISFPQPPRSGKVVIQLKNISKSYGNNVIFRNLDLMIQRGEKIALVGPNGAGKSTLANLLAGKIKPDSGEIIPGHNTVISFYTQEVADDLDPSLDILDSVAGIDEDKSPGELRALLGSFLFRADDVFKKIAVLSGGEKSRVALCKILLTKANFIILDEPTNHLDMVSKNILREALIDFEGTLVLVSHDIDFLSPVVNKVIEIRKYSFKIFEGGIEYYLRKREELNDQKVVKGEIKNKYPAESISKKEKKKADAELRQKRYRATINLKKEISSLENTISELEKEKSLLENEIANPHLYNEPEKAKELNLKYKLIKEELEKTLDKWITVSSELDEIEKSFG